LHSYLRVADIGRVSIQGLKGLSYVDKVLGESVTGPHRHPQNDEELRMVGEVDRVYLDARRPIVLDDGARVLEVRKTGFDDVVTWNPGPDLSARLKDLGPNGYRTMVCIEPGAVAKPIVLEPGTEWRGTQELELHSK
jgi:glucose-6-phosphate 1-epimerase